MYKQNNGLGLLRLSPLSLLPKLNGCSGVPRLAEDTVVEAVLHCSKIQDPIEVDAFQFRARLTESAHGAVVWQLLLLLTAETAAAAVARPKPATEDAVLHIQRVSKVELSEVSVTTRTFHSEAR